MRTKKETTAPLARLPRPVRVVQSNKTCKCGTCEPSRPKLPEGARRLKVYSKWKANGYQQDPVILLQGEWLRNTGFDIGDQVLITVNKKHLIISFEEE